MLQTTAKSSAMVPRMIWDMLFWGQKLTKNRFFGQNPLWSPLQNSSKSVFWAQKHSQTPKNHLKNTQTYSNILKHTPTMPVTTLVTQTTAPFWLNKYFEIWAFKDFKTHCKSCFGVRKTRVLGFTDVFQYAWNNSGHRNNSSVLTKWILWDMSV